MWPFAPKDTPPTSQTRPQSPYERSTVILNVEAPPAPEQNPPAPLNTEFRDHRLSLPFSLRLAITAAFCLCAGFYRGAGKGGTSAALRYRAENAHRLPTTRNGWYYYHRTKNYHIFLGSVRGGAALGGQLAVWGCLFTSFEEGVDRLRAGTGRRRGDVASTVFAGLGTAAFYNLVKRHDMFTSSRLGKTALRFSLVYGLAQDLLSTLRGIPPAYVEWLATKFGLRDRLPDAG